jgi:glycerophosphoryl diester phosphodiesterase
LAGEDKEAQYQFYGFIILILLLFWLEARFFIFSQLPLTIYELIPYGGIVVLLFYLYSYAPLKRKNESQGKVQAIDYADSMVRRGKSKPDDVMLPFKEVYNIPIDFDDNGGLILKLKSKTYRKHYISYLESQITPNMSDDTNTIEGDSLKNVLEMLTPKLLEMRNDGLLENVIKNDVEDKKKKDKKALDSKDEIEALEDEIDVDIQQWDVEKVSGEEIEILKKLNIYWVLLDSPQNYKDEKEKWDQIFIVIPNYSYKNALATRKSTGFYNNWPVILKECFCFWEHLWDLTGKVQVLYLVFSENFDEPYLEPLKNLKAQAYAFLQLKVMETWNNDLEVKPERLEKTRDHYREKARALGETLSDVVQDTAADNIIFSKFMNNPAQKKLMSEIEKYKRRFILALSGIIIAILTMGLVVAILL